MFLLVKLFNWICHLDMCTHPLISGAVFTTKSTHSGFEKETFLDVHSVYLHNWVIVRLDRVSFMSLRNNGFTVYVCVFMRGNSSGSRNNIYMYPQQMNSLSLLCIDISTCKYVSFFAFHKWSFWNKLRKFYKHDSVPYWKNAARLEADPTSST